MRLEAMKRQGKRTDLTSTPLVEKLSEKENLSVSRIGAEVGEVRTNPPIYPLNGACSRTA